MINRDNDDFLNTESSRGRQWRRAHSSNNKVNRLSQRRSLNPVADQYPSDTWELKMWEMEDIMLRLEVL
ncbi:unnamed protein product [Angiostrongylus costaricensis]|uniref:Uncharacterized protein n=1 Tax=Angiostrongylus costaricensis TaxID=334426 RepID=A0A0R3PUQ7_ANGCS|nr:unnamed protein product [Angiostrongylus costaricensis]